MITTIGTVDVTERRKAFRASILAFLEGDELMAIFWGGDDAVDFLGAELVDRNGALWFMGRIRHHRDRAIFGSDDLKEPVYVAAAPGTAPDVWVRIAQTVVMVGAKYRGISVKRIPASARTTDEFTRALTDAVTAAGGRIGIAKFEKGSKLAKDMGYETEEDA